MQFDLLLTPHAFGSARIPLPHRPHPHRRARTDPTSAPAPKYPNRIGQCAAFLGIPSEHPQHSLFNVEFQATTIAMFSKVVAA
jgi:hypothetical protein